MTTCSKCGELKPIHLFYKHKASKDGHRPDCKACLDARGKAYRQQPDIKARSRAYHKNYRSNVMTDDQKRRERASIDRWTRETPRHALYLSRSNALKRCPTENPISLQQLLDLFSEQNGLCALSGIKMTWRKWRILPTSISLDRIDNAVGYIHGNVRLVCYSVNAFRNTMTDAEMLAMARAIVAKADADDKDPTWKGFGYSAPIHTFTVN